MCPCQGAGVAENSGAASLRRGSNGTSCSERSRFWWTHHWADTAEPLTQAGGSSGKIQLRKGKTTTQQCEGEMRKQKVSKTSAKTRVRERREEVLQAPEQTFSCSLWSRYPHCSLRRTPHQSKWIFTDWTGAHGGVGEQYEEKELLWTDISPITLHCSEQGCRVQDEEVTSSLGKGSEVGGSVVLACLWLSQSKSILTDSKLNFVQV